MTGKAALTGAALATLGLVLPAGTSSPATQTVTSFIGPADNRDGAGPESCCQDLDGFRPIGGADALSAFGDDPLTDAIGGDEADAALERLGASPAEDADRAPAKGGSANAELALGIETVSGSSASRSLSDRANEAPDVAGVADAAASPSIWTRMWASFIGANGSGSGGAP